MLTLAPPLVMCNSKLSNILADLLDRIAKPEDIHYIMDYLDDFLCLGPPMFFKYQ